MRGSGGRAGRRRRGVGSAWRWDASRSPRARVGARPFVQGDGASESGPAGGLTPAQLASAYEYDPAEGGAGQTVALIDAFDDPNIEADLATFDSHYGLHLLHDRRRLLRRRSGRPAARPRCPKPTKPAGRSRSRSTSRPPTRSVRSARSCSWRPTTKATPTSSAAVERGGRAGRDRDLQLLRRLGGNRRRSGLRLPRRRDHGLRRRRRLRRLGRSQPKKPPVLPERAGGARLASDRGVGRRHLPLPQRKRHPLAARRSGITTGPTTKSVSKRNRRKAPAAGAAAPCSPRQPWQQNAPGWGASGCGTKRLDNDVAAVADPYTGFDIYDSYNCGKYLQRRRRRRRLGNVGRHLARPRRSSPRSTGWPAARRGQLPGGDALQPPRPGLVLRRHRRRQRLLRRRTRNRNAATPTRPTKSRSTAKARPPATPRAGFDGPSGVGTPKGLRGFKKQRHHAAHPDLGDAQRAGQPRRVNRHRMQVRIRHLDGLRHAGAVQIAARVRHAARWRSPRTSRVSRPAPNTTSAS